MTRILVVEDDKSNAAVIQLLLEEAGHQVSNIQDSSFLHEVIAHFLPELIIMDILLQKEDGRKLCNEIKQDVKIMHIPIILLTAMLQAQALSVKSQADVLMFKPFDCRILLGYVEALSAASKVYSS